MSLSFWQKVLASIIAGGVLAGFSGLVIAGSMRADVAALKRQEATNTQAVGELKTAVGSLKTEVKNLKTASGNQRREQREDMKEIREALRNILQRLPKEG